MNWKNFYVVGDEDRRDALCVIPEDSIDESSLLMAGYLPEKPIKYKRHLGKTPYDIIPTGHAGLFLVSERVVNTLTEGRFSGWSLFPVEVYGKGRVNIDGYWGFACTGRCGPIDPQRSQRVWLPPPIPTGRGSAWRLGLYFDPGSWDGSDCFMPDRTFHLIVVESIRKALETARITNIHFQPLSAVEFPILANGAGKYR